MGHKWRTVAKMLYQTKHSRGIMHKSGEKETTIKIVSTRCIAI